MTEGKANVVGADIVGGSLSGLQQPLPPVSFAQSPFAGRAGTAPALFFHSSGRRGAWHGQLACGAPGPGRT